jgi:hypothetical protein
MTHSDSLANLGAALVLAQAEIENAHKNAKNPHFKSNYADLAEIINTVRPTLTKHGLSVVQIPGFAEGVVTVETMLLHKSGEWIKGTAGAPASKQDAQGVGSAVTYLRRYSLAAVCAIAQEDDDGNAASQPKQATAAHTAPVPAAKKPEANGDRPATDDQLKAIGRLVDQKQVDHDMYEQIAAELASGTMSYTRAGEIIKNLDKLPKAVPVNA